MNNVLNKSVVLIGITAILTACGGNKLVVDESADYKSARAFPGLKKEPFEPVVKAEIPAERVPIQQKSVESKAAEIVQEPVAEISSKKEVLTEQIAIEAPAESLQQSGTQVIEETVDAVELPAADDAVELSAADDVIELPAADDVIELPAADDAVELSAADDAVELSAADDVIELPAADDVIELPVAVDAVELPVAVDAVELPAADDVVELPAADDAVELPVAVDAVELPAADTAVELSAAGIEEIDGPKPSGSVTAQLVEVSEAFTRLQIDLPLEQAWLLIGERLKSAAFTIHSRNEMAGRYAIGCASIKQENQVVKRSGKWSFFKSTVEPNEYCAIQVIAKDSGSMVSVLNRYALEVVNDDAQPILQRLLN